MVGSLLTQVTYGRPPQLVMFDLDGTLVDSVPDLAVAVDAVLLANHAAPAGEQLVRQWVGNGAKALIESALAYAGLPCADENVTAALAHFKDCYHGHCAVYTRLYDGVLPCLEYLAASNITMAVVTNKPREFVPIILSSLSIDHFFSCIVGGDDLPRRKPAADPLEHCLSILSRKAESSVMIGDSCHDIRAARNAGVPVIAVDYGYNHGHDICEYEPDTVVSSLSELF